MICNIKVESFSCVFAYLILVNVFIQSVLLLTEIDDKIKFFKTVHGLIFPELCLKLNCMLQLD